MSTGLPRPGLARSAHRGRIKFLRGYVSISSAAVNRPTHDHAASLSEVARTSSMRSAFRGPAHQLAVRMRINNCTHGHYGPSNQPCTSNCTSAEGLHFSAFHYHSGIPTILATQVKRTTLSAPAGTEEPVLPHICERCGI